MQNFKLLLQIFRGQRPAHLQRRNEHHGYECGIPAQGCPSWEREVRSDVWCSFTDGVETPNLIERFYFHVHSSALGSQRLSMLYSLVNTAQPV